MPLWLHIILLSPSHAAAVYFWTYVVLSVFSSRYQGPAEVTHDVLVCAVGLPSTFTDTSEELCAF